MADRTEIVVHPPAPGGGRRVTAHVLGVDAALGTAYRLADVDELLRRAGLEDIALTEDGPVTWQGGGPDTWTTRPPSGR